MKQTSIFGNPAYRFGAGVLGIWLVISLFIVGIYYLIWKSSAPDSASPSATTSTYAFENEFSVAAAVIHQNTGEALVRLEGFNIPVKFKFNTDPTIEITDLEIGEITSVYGKSFNDFTTRQDHRSINAALVAYIKQNEANQ
ncbi:hypothetical protein AVENLUH5627_02456 [Acinetobacter venetianus]|uniref:Uncharacterized protein n=1 Tax=Acinetobacter venetianus TaxID=52133 RepID=A0A150HM40_9GAMM|nr:hypothetical protein [Acinetobacter venetianus]KXZ66762.1 hypothetical protein AVENLUH5627_02456 [Acinetobacter venetianus]